MAVRGSSSRVKVQTDRLLDAVKARRAAIVKEHEAAVAGYAAKVEAYQGKVVTALQKALGAAEKGRFPDQSYRSLEVPFKAKKPEKPCLDTGGIDRLIQTLEMAAEPTLTISAEDAARYLG